MLSNNYELVTSTLTLAEILVKPIERDAQNFIDLYKNICTNPNNIKLISFDRSAAYIFAKIRAKYSRKVKPPDAIQIACAASYGVDIFITNDDRLADIKIDNISKVLSLSKAIEELNTI